jgi:hypothetical protein
VIGYRVFTREVSGKRQPITNNREPITENRSLKTSGLIGKAGAPPSALHPALIGIARVCCFLQQKQWTNALLQVKYFIIEYY